MRSPLRSPTWPKLYCVLALCAAATGCDQPPVVVARIPYVESEMAGSSAPVPDASTPPDPDEICPLPEWHGDASYVVTNGCLVPESQRATLDRIAALIMERQPPPPPGETREPDWCDIYGVQFYPDEMNPGQYRLCQPLCDLVAYWASRAWEQRRACLADAGLSL